MPLLPIGTLLPSMHALLAAIAANIPHAPAPKGITYGNGKHAKGHRPAKNAKALRKSRQKMAKASRRRNRSAA